MGSSPKNEERAFLSGACFVDRRRAAPLEEEKRIRSLTSQYEPSRPFLSSLHHRLLADIVARLPRIQAWKGCVALVGDCLDDILQETEAAAVVPATFISSRVTRDGPTGAHVTIFSKAEVDLILSSYSFPSLLDSSSSSSSSSNEIRRATQFARLVAIVAEEVVFDIVDLGIGFAQEKQHNKL